LRKIEEEMAAPDFWGKSEESHKVLRTRRQLEDSITMARGYRETLEDIETLMELLAEGEEVLPDLTSEITGLDKRLSETEIQSLLSGPHDSHNAIVTIHPGAGGTESQDWAEMLLRMYLRWAEQQGFKAEVTDYQPGEEAGIKSVTLLIQGHMAYGLLAAEIGVHRLVRISPYDAAARRHTSFASVFVTPEIEEDEEDIPIDEKDLRIDTYRSSGAGGQHVNVTDSAVRITHLPSGIVVQCQNERSQHRNKDRAIKILKSKLYEQKMEEKRKELDQIEDGKAEIGWGSQIRSYVLHPYRLVKDHRTKSESGNVDAVLDGGIDPFIAAYLNQRSQMKQKEAQSRSVR
jgi:peptide chain release factor 2